MIVRADPMSKSGFFLVGRTSCDERQVKVRIELEFETPEQAKEFTKLMYAAHNNPLVTCEMILDQANKRSVLENQTRQRDEIAQNGQSVANRFGERW